MESLAKSVNKFLEFNEYKILEGNGTVSKKQAVEKRVKNTSNLTKLKK
jgi:hypothetical protein